MLKVRTSLKAAGIFVQNHARRALKVRSSIRAGGIDPFGNHNRRLLRAE